MEKLQVQNLDLSNTQVTAAAWLQSSMNDATISVSPGQFIHRVLELLRERYKVQVVSPLESQ